jgi:glycosyltransferase involved in cell wall biosynthesis
VIPKQVKYYVVDVIIPAYNEEQSIGLVLNDIPKSEVRNIVVVNNNSTDLTKKVALQNGATVLKEAHQGYGAACLKGLNYLKNMAIVPDIVVFLDADYSDDPTQLPSLLEPIKSSEVQLVVGSRSLGKKEKGAMMPQQIFGNWLATGLMKILYGSRFTDLGPFRAITWKALDKIQMADRDFGWTVEMQVKALKKGIPYTEIPVSYKKRKGVSKITGTVKGSFSAGYKIISTIVRYA